MNTADEHLPGTGLTGLSSFSSDPCGDEALYLTGEHAGTGGILRQRPEDFLVEELPLYEPSGAGEHLYLFVEKTRLTTLQVAGALADHFGVPRHAVGFAGLKDKIAITRQVFSVHLPGKSAAGLERPFEHERIKILWTARHQNKLRRGHLAGNRFVIRIREVEPAHVVRAHRILTSLQRSGTPNRLGPQRFGILGNNHIVGRALILGRAEEALDALLSGGDLCPHIHGESRSLYRQGRFADARDALPHTSRVERAALNALARGRKPNQALWAIDPVQRSFFLTAFQSAVFNACLASRLRAGALGTLQRGDVAFVHPHRATFPVDDAVLADPETAERLRRLDISPSGPMWGASMRRASLDVDAVECAALATCGITLEDIAAHAKASRDALEGDRRPYRVPVLHASVESGVDEHSAFIRCAFDLPRGAFASVVMDEIMKARRTEALISEDVESELPAE